MWRQANFGVIGNTGNAADNADPDQDGLENLVEYAFGLNPNLADAAALPRWQLSDDDYKLSFNSPGGVSGITYYAEQSTTLVPASWTAIPNAAGPPQFSVLI